MSSDPSAVIGADGHHAPASNPHVLWKNVLAIVIAGLVVFLVALPIGLLAILAGVFTFVDAWHSGIYKKPNSKAFLNLSPGARRVAVMGLLIIGYPCYLFARNRLKTKQGPTIYWALANVFGVIALALVGLTIMAQFAAAWLTSA